MKDIPLQNRSSTERVLARAIQKCRPSRSRGNWTIYATASEGLALIAAGARPIGNYDFQWFTQKVKEGDGWASDWSFVARKELKAKLDKAHNEPHRKIRNR